LVAPTRGVVFEGVAGRAGGRPVLWSFRGWRGFGGLLVMGVNCARVGVLCDSYCSRAVWRGAVWFREGAGNIIFVL
jgi:hypothetical protein